MKKMMAKMVELGGLALVFLAAALSDGGTSLGMVACMVFLGLLAALGGNFAAWKCAHPSRKPSVVRFRPADAPALCVSSAPVAAMPAAGMRRAG